MFWLLFLWMIYIEGSRVTNTTIMLLLSNSTFHWYTCIQSVMCLWTWKGGLNFAFLTPQLSETNALNFTIETWSLFYQIDNAITFLNVIESLCNKMAINSLSLPFPLTIWFVHVYLCFVCGSKVVNMFVVMWHTY